MFKLPMYSEGHILSDPGLLATFFEGILIRRPFLFLPSWKNVRRQTFASPEGC
jgi:hypothetical protein